MGLVNLRTWTWTWIKNSWTKTINVTIGHKQRRGLVVTSVKARRLCPFFKKNTPCAFWWKMAATMEPEVGKDSSLNGCARDGIAGRRTKYSGPLLYCTYNTAGLERWPAVIRGYHCRSQTQTGSDKGLSLPVTDQTGSDKGLSLPVTDPNRQW